MSPVINRESQKEFVQFWNVAHFLVKQKIATQIRKDHKRGKGKPP